jgi:hypothetical protein
MFLILPALWVFLEIARSMGDDRSAGWAIMGFHQYCIAWAGLMISSQPGLRLAIHAGLLERVWLSTGRRVVGLILGVGMVLFGNALPTLRSPWTLRQQPLPGSRSTASWGGCERQRLTDHRMKSC